MTVLSQIELMQLMDATQTPCISLYMPTHVAGREQQQDAICHKSLLKRAEQQFAEQDGDKTVGDRVLGSLAGIPADDDLWNHRSEGLAAFAAPGFFRTFVSPLEFEQRVVVSDEFYISPLLPLLHANSRFFILALTKSTAELYEATRYTIREHGLARLSPIEVDGTEQSLQYHSQRAPSQVKGASAEALYHGHGGADDRENADIANFFKRQVDPEVNSLLKGQTAPLVLACVDSLAPLYREANAYEFLIDAHVSGSPSELSERVLREQVWQLVESAVREVETAAKEQFQELSGSDRALTDVIEITKAASEGRVDTLLLPALPTASEGTGRSMHAAGQSSQAVRAVPDEDIEEAVKRTLLNSGRVLAVKEMPDGYALAAILRY